MHRYSLTAVCALLGGASVIATGCEQAKSNKPATEKQDQTANAEKGEGGPCAGYASAVCEKAGEASPSCGSVKSAAELLPPAACEAALANVDFSLAKLEEKKATCTELENKLCSDLGEDTESCEMVREKTGQFPPARCEQMLGEYDKVLAGLKEHEKKNQPLSAEKAKTIATGDVPAFGPEDAAVTIVEFSDFQCPYCSRAAEVTEKIREEYGDKVRFVFRQFPLSMHPQAEPAARASLAAHEQGKFWEYHDKLFANQRELSDEKLVEYAKQTGLDVQAFQKSMKDEAHKKQVKTDMGLGSEANVSGTPTMFLNGKRISNPTSFEVVKQMIDEELKAS